MFITQGSARLPSSAVLLPAAGARVPKLFPGDSCAAWTTGEHRGHPGTTAAAVESHGWIGGCNIIYIYWESSSIDWGYIDVFFGSLNDHWDYDND